MDICAAEGAGGAALTEVVGAAGATSVPTYTRLGVVQGLVVGVRVAVPVPPIVMVDVPNEPGLPEQV